jgi:hypothetical protein
VDHAFDIRIVYEADEHAEVGDARNDAGDNLADSVRSRASSFTFAESTSRSETMILFVR